MNKYNQEENIDYVMNRLGNGLWVPVCGFVGEDHFLFTQLIGKNKSKSFLRDVGRGVPIEEPIGFTKVGDKVIYNLYRREGECYFVRYRTFHGTFDDYYELSDEFLLNFNALKQSDRYVSVLGDGRIEDVARYLPNGSIEVKNSYLRRFAAIKQMNIAFEFDFRYSSQEPLGNDIADNYVYSDDDIKYEFCSGSTGLLENHYFSRLLGRKIIRCGPVESSGVWPYEKEKSYEEFIVGTDENGEPIKCICDPDLLNNYFNSNPGKCHYLTPVAFKREVLKKYLDHPNRYAVKGCRLSCGTLWAITLDMDHDDLVFAYLGDLGRDLPESEYAHWKSFNVITDEKLSNSAVNRDFGARFSEPENIEYRFQKIIAETNAQWTAEFGWSLFLPLLKDDEYCYQKAIMPVMNEQHELDSLCLALSKVAIDSINIGAIKQAGICLPPGESGSINYLEAFLTHSGVDAAKAKEIAANLRCVQRLRSQLTGHRKGNDVDKTYAKCGIDSFVKDHDYISAAKRVFMLMVEALEGIKNAVLSGC